MKKILTTIALFYTLGTFAQAPQKISYQAVIRNSSNTLVTSAPIGMQISILQGSPTGTAVYVETQSATTNINGLATIQIGGGTVVSGSFASINWAAGSYYILTETDPTGGTTYTISSTTQFLSVPYALYAETSGTAGPMGATGATGANGLDGATGAAGTNGIDGATGANGLDGATGAAGTNGVDGATGANGIDGATGATGVAGINGTNGTNGATGATGATGTTGTAGTNGTNGTNGATGVTGATGTTGTNGTNGATGATGAAGTNGTNGVTGATGATGTAGTNGTNGTNGATGVTGATGTAGTNGTNGATGATGAAGTNGTNGVTGATGATGTAGTNGTNGTNGATGVTGATGTAGTNGTNGTTGATGATGATGTANISGTTNYVLKFTAATTAGNSQLFDNGTNVGLGTTSPIDKFHVSGGGIRVENANPTLVLDHTGFAQMSRLYFRDSYGNGNGDILFSQTNGLSFTANGYGEVMRLSSAGNVGIGTNNPGAKLDLNGTFKLVDGTQAAGKVLTSDASGNATWHKAAFSSVTGTTAIAFTGSGAWINFPDLSTSVTLVNAADVLITYNTANQIACGGSYFFVTRVLIDGVEAKEFRVIESVSGTNYFSNSAAAVVNIASGAHTITVQYRTNSCVAPPNNDPSGTDYMTRNLTVRELK